MPPDPTPPLIPTPAREEHHTGNKYLRKIHCTRDGAKGFVDIYDILDAYKVTCPAVAHAVKKLLCAGLRGKGSASQDLREALDAVKRAIELDRSRFIETMEEESDRRMAQ